jgi:hypothetical protein
MNIKTVHGQTFYNGLALRPHASLFIKKFNVQVFDYLALDEPELVINGSGHLAYHFPLSYACLVKLCNLMDKMVLNPLKNKNWMIEDIVFFQKDFEEKVKILDLVVSEAVFMANFENQTKNRKNGI